MILYNFMYIFYVIYYFRFPLLEYHHIIMPPQVSRGFQQNANFRSSLRRYDISESYHLLLELGYQEPTVQTCLNLITNAILAQDIGLKIKGQEISNQFQKHVNIHYHNFCHDAIRAMFVYGFVPWFPKKLCSGDVVPSVLPPGTFSWSVKPSSQDDGRRDYQYNSSKRRRSWDRDTSHARHNFDNERTRKRDIRDQQSNSSNKDRNNERGKNPVPSSRWDHLRIPHNDSYSGLLHYDITVTVGDIDPEDVFIFNVNMIGYNISMNSSVYATLPSPMSHLLVEYKNFREAQIRRSYADAWNTTARIFTSCNPPNTSNSEPTNSYIYWETGNPNSIINDGRPFWNNRRNELETQIEKPSNHTPSLFTLPIYHRIEQLSSLQPCEDLAFLLEKFRHDVCDIIGVPFELCYGHINAHNTTASASDMITRSFNNTVLRITKILEELILEVYCIIYNGEKDDIEVSLSPMPRIDVKNMDDVVKLYEMGAITPDMIAQLSEILLVSDRTGVTGKKMKTTHPPETFVSNLDRINKSEHPQSNTQAAKNKSKK
jgi:hypothetical protein